MHELEGLFYDLLFGINFLFLAHRWRETCEFYMDTEILEEEFSTSDSKDDD